MRNSYLHELQTLNMTPRLEVVVDKPNIADLFYSYPDRVERKKLYGYRLNCLKDSTEFPFY